MSLTLTFQQIFLYLHEEVLKVNSRTRSEPCFMLRRSCLQSCKMHSLLNAAVVTKMTVSQLGMDLLSLMDSLLKSRLSLDSGMEGPFVLARLVLGGLHTPLLSFDTVCPPGVDTTFPGWIYFT